MIPVPAVVLIGIYPATQGAVKPNSVYRDYKRYELLFREPHSKGCVARSQAKRSNKVSNPSGRSLIATSMEIVGSACSPAERLATGNLQCQDAVVLFESVILWIFVYTSVAMTWLAFHLGMHGNATNMHIIRTELMSIKLWISFYTYRWLDGPRSGHESSCADAP
jgi:hypothetical protein